MRPYLYLILLLSTLASCINAENIEYVFPKHYLDGHSAKVWVLEKSSLENDSALPYTKAYRKTFILYDNKTFIEQDFIHLGSQQGDYGRFWIVLDAAGNPFLRLNYVSKIKEEIHYYDILHIDKHTLILKNQENSVVWEFKSLTPPL